MKVPKKKMRENRSVAAIFLLGLVRLYQLILSPLLGPRCRFQPTCSNYAIEAIQTHGGAKGSWLTAKRIARCHPWGGFGYDPVPQSDHESADQSITSDHDDDKRTDTVNIKVGKSQLHSGCDTDG